MSSNGISTERKRLTTSRNRHKTGHARLVITLGLAMAMIATAANSSSAAGPTWLAPESLSGADNETVDSPQAGLDAVGNTTVVWSTKKGDEGRIKFTDRPVGGKWSAPDYIPASGALGESVRNLQLAVDAEGNAVSLLRYMAGGSWKSVEAHRDAGGEWSRFAELSEGHKTGIPRITVAGGNSVATWTRMNYSSDGVFFGTDVWTRIRADGQSWGNAKALSVEKLVGSQQAAVNDAGDAVVVWVSYNKENQAMTTIKASSYSTERGWSESPVNVSHVDVSMAYTADVAVDEVGNTIVVWRQFNNNDGSWYIKSAYRPAVASPDDPNGGWNEPVDIYGGGLSAKDLQVEVKGDGKAVAVWSQVDGENRNTYAVTSKANGGWGEPTVVGTVDGSRRSPHPDPQLAVNAAGDATVVWVVQDDMDSSYGIYSATQSADSDTDDNGGDWTEPVGVATGMSSNPGVAGIAIDGEGNSVTTWTDRSGTSVVRAAAHDAAGPRLVGLNVPATGTVGVPISFSVSSFDAWSGNVGTTWSFGDGQQVTGPSVSHSYTSAGTYQVQAKAADLVGNDSTETRTITISPGAQDPDTGPPATQPSDLSNPGVTTPRAKLQGVSLSGVSLQTKCLKQVRTGSKHSRTRKRKKTGRLVSCKLKSKLTRRLVVRFESSAVAKVKLRVSRRVKKRIRGKKSRFVTRTVLKRTLTAKKGKNRYVLAIKKGHARSRLMGKLYVKGAKNATAVRVRK